MSGKFAVLHYASSRDEFILDKKLAGSKNEKLKDKYVERNLPLKMTPCTICGIEGMNVVLPLTKEDTARNPELRHEVYVRVLNILIKNNVRAVKAVEGEDYQYDAMIPAVSGFYTLPFLLPLFLKSAAKSRELQLEKLEVVIVDGIADLTLDTLCIIAPEVNYITVFTENAEYFQAAADNLFGQTGLSIRITDNPADFTFSSADVVFSASEKLEKGLAHLKKGAIYFDLVGCRQNLTDIAARYSSLTAIDGLQLKYEGAYIDNKALELMLMADDDRFLRYVYGRYSDNDFYGVLDRIADMELRMTTFLRFGKSV